MQTREALNASVMHAFDEIAIRGQVTELHKSANGIDGIFVICAFPNDAKGGGTITHHKVGDVEGTVASIMAHAETDCNVYMPLHVMRTGIPRRSRGTAADIVAVLGLVVDQDADTGKSGPLPLEPSWIIQTSPGNYQPAILFARPMAPEDAKRLAKALQLATGADYGTADIAHVWRIAGTQNLPNAGKRARGRHPAPVTLVKPFAGLTYTHEALVEALTPYMRAEKAASSQHSFTHRVDDEPLWQRVSEKARELLVSDGAPDRSVHAARVIEQLIFDDLSIDDAISVCASRGGAWKDRYASEAEFIRDTERLFNKITAEKNARKDANEKAAFNFVYANDHEPVAPKPMMTEPSTNPFEFANAGGLIGELAEWIYNTSRSPIREFSMMAAIAVMTACFGRRAVGPTGIGLNLYIVMVAGTGFGKDRALTVGSSILRALGGFGQKLVGPTNVTGDTAIERALRVSPCLLCPMDEFGLLLKAANDRNAASWTQTIRRALLELFSRSAPDQTWKAKATAYKVKGAPDTAIEQPTLSILGATTPAEFYDGLTTSATSNGFLNRLLVIVADERPQIQDIPALNPVPPALADRLKTAIDTFPRPEGALTAVSFSDPNMPARMTAVPYADDKAKQRFQVVEDDKMRMLDSETELSGIVERAGEMTSKLATLRAISTCPEKPSVKVEDIEWAWAIVHRSILSVGGGVARYMSGSQAEALRKLVLGHIVDAGDAGLHNSVLMRKRGVGRAAPHELEAAIKWLERSGQIANIGKIDAKTGRGRSGEKYLAAEFTMTAAA